MKKTILLLTAALLLTGCITTPTTPPSYKSTKTSLELQAIQTKELEVPKKIVFASTMFVLQDLGYSIISSDLDTGYISAKSPTQSSFSYPRVTLTDTKVTAFIEQLRPGVTQVRLSFVNSEEWQMGLARMVQENPIDDAIIYNNAFVKIQEAIFIRSAVN
jgi:hypothetical protein